MKKTVKQLADELGVSKTYIANILKSNEKEFAKIKAEKKIDICIMKYKLI